MQAADIDAMDVTVTNLSNIVTVFDIVGVGTTAVLENILISSNNISKTSPNNLWIGINVRDNAVGSITNSTFLDNTNLRHIFSASSTATIDVQSSMIVGASGGRVVVSHCKSLNIQNVSYPCLSHYHHLHFLRQNERDISAGVFSNIQSMVSLTNFKVEDTESFTVRTCGDVLVLDIPFIDTSNISYFTFHEGHIFCEWW